MPNKIKSETQFIVNLIIHIIKFPFILILALFSPKYRKELKKPFTEVTSFFLEAKITFALFLLNIIAFLYEIFFMSASQVETIALMATQFNPLAMIGTWFLHASFSHLFWNMLTLLIFGRIVERNFRSKTWFIYFGSAFISSFISLIFEGPGIGASGAIAGLIAAAILIEPFYRTFISLIPLPIAIVGLGFISADVFAVINPVIGDNVGHFAHLGGYLAISLLLFLFSREQRRKMKWGLLINIVFVILMLLFM